MHLFRIRFSIFKVYLGVSGVATDFQNKQKQVETFDGLELKFFRVILYSIRLNSWQ
jgi:hypothetical protein